MGLRVNTDGGDFDPVTRPHPFTRHRNELAFPPKTDITARLDRARHKGARFRHFCEGEHLGDVLILKRIELSGRGLRRRTRIDQRKIPGKPLRRHFGDIGGQTLRGRGRLFL